MLCTTASVGGLIEESDGHIIYEGGIHSTLCRYIRYKCCDQKTWEFSGNRRLVLVTHVSRHCRDYIIISLYNSIPIHHSHQMKVSWHMLTLICGCMGITINLQLRYNVYMVGFWNEYSILGSSLLLHYLWLCPQYRIVEPMFCTHMGGLYSECVVEIPCHCIRYEKKR